MTQASSTSGQQIDLFQIVYGELRQLAAGQLSTERAGHTLNPTALVHEVYLRLADTLNNTANAKALDAVSRKQFFLLAAEAMRHILVDHARYHSRQKRGGDMHRQQIMLDHLPAPEQPDVLAVHEALNELAAERPEAAALVKLRYFAGLSLNEAADLLELKASTADRRWAFAKAWLFERLSSKSKKTEKDRE
ncbi:MAG: ECF-type sigma factor [Gemmatales bacterium]